MRGGSAILCPACGHREVVGHPGERVGLPLRVVCSRCGAALILEPSLSGGAHVSVEKTPAG
jgi:DNA-directed RNA polymerase subunit RPC12/RpoP